MFIIADNARASGEDVKRFGVVRDKDLKLEDGEASLTLGGVGGEVPKERDVERWRGVCEWEG